MEIFSALLALCAGNSLNRLFNAQIKENIKAPRQGFCEGNSPVTGEFPPQKASYVEKISFDDANMDRTVDYCSKRGISRQSS